MFGRHGSAWQPRVCSIKFELGCNTSQETGITLKFFLLPISKACILASYTITSKTREHEGGF